MESPGGLYIGARRNAEAGHYYWRITQWIMPWYTMVPPYGDNALNAHAWVPIDDENCFTWTFTYHPTRPLSDMELDTMRRAAASTCRSFPARSGRSSTRTTTIRWIGRRRKAGAPIRASSGIAMQDASVQESMGPIQDRSKENLVSTDNAIIMARHRLLQAALALQKGVAPPGLEPGPIGCARRPSCCRSTCRSLQAKREDLTVREGVPHTSI